MRLLVFLLLPLVGVVSTAQWQNADNGLSNNWNVNEGKNGFAPDSLAYAYSTMLAFTQALDSPDKILALRWLQNGCVYRDCKQNAKEHCFDFVSNDLASKMVFEIEWSLEYGDTLVIDVYLSSADVKIDPTKWFLKIKYNTKTKKIYDIRNLVCK